MNSFSLEIGEIILESIILKEYVLVSCLAYIFKFVFCSPCQSSPSLTILVLLWFIIISLVFFCLSNILFLGLLLSKDNFFLHGQNNWKSEWLSSIEHVSVLIILLLFFFCGVENLPYYFDLLFDSWRLYLHGEGRWSVRLCAGGSLDISSVPGCTIPGANEKTAKTLSLACVLF